MSQVIANSYPTDPRNYKSAGFENVDQVHLYADNYQYLAFKISNDDWKAFYTRFPEYWVDIQKSKSYTFMNDFNSGYTAYAFRWNMMRRLTQWDRATTNRLKAGKVDVGDDIYQLVFALGMPNRLLWDNDYDIIFYGDRMAIQLSEGRLTSVRECKGCTALIGDEEKKQKNLDQVRDYFVKNDDEVLAALGLKRPEF